MGWYLNSILWSFILNGSVGQSICSCIELQIANQISSHKPFGYNFAFSIFLTLIPTNFDVDPIGNQPIFSLYCQRPVPVTSDGQLQIFIYRKQKTIKNNNNNNSAGYKMIIISLES